MSKMDNTSFLPIFNHRHFKAVPGQNSLGGVSHIFLMLSNSDGLVTPCKVVQKDCLKLLIFSGPVQESGFFHSHVCSFRCYRSLHGFLLMLVS